MGKVAKQEVEGVIPQVVVFLVFHNAIALARTFKGNIQYLTNAGSGAIGHHD